MMGQEASTLAIEYGPQWMNMPNFACWNQAVRCAPESAFKGVEAAGWALLTEGMLNRRVNALVIRKQENLPPSLMAIRPLLVGPGH